MKKIVILCLLFCAHNINAQKIQIDKIDKFTNNRIVETSKVKIVTPKSDFKIRVEGNNVNLDVQLWNIIGLNETSIKANNSELLIITNTGERYSFQTNTINLEHINKHSSIHWGGGISTGWTTTQVNINLKFHIDTDTLNLLNNSIIDDMRIIIGSSYINFDKLDSYEKKCITKLFKLAMQTL